MRLAAEAEPAPFGFVRSDRYRRDLRIAIEIFLRQHQAKILGAEPGVLPGDHVDDVLDRVGRDRGGIVGVCIGTGEIALDHRLDVELADLVPLAVAMDTHHADAALAVSVLDQRHGKVSSSAGKSTGLIKRDSVPPVWS